MKRYAIAAMAVIAALLAGCGGQGTASTVVPSLSQGASAAANAGAAAGSGRTAALHAAAQCIRAHGIPAYQDPVLTPGGAVYSDSRSIEDAPPSTVNAVHQACRTVLTQAGLSPGNEPPAPAQLVRAGVKLAECLRAHGLPNVVDPTARTTYTPGHGFGMTATEMPSDGKASPVWQGASRACHAQIAAELTASTLGSLGNDG
jgi:hypothetical protein